MLTALLRRPATAFSVLAIAVLLAHGLAVLFIARISQASLAVTTQAGGMVHLIGEDRAYRGDAPAQFIDRDGNALLVVPMMALVPGLQPYASAAQRAEEHRQRDLIAEMVRRPGMTIRLPDGRHLPALVHPGQITALPLGVWLSLAIALCSSLAGLWALVLRPQEWAARMFMLSGVGLALGAITIGMNVQFSMAVGAQMIFWATHINYLSALAFGSALVALFARYPLPLIRTQWLVIGALLQAVLWLVNLSEQIAVVMSLLIVVVLMLGVTTVVLAGVQGWRSRRDPAMRAAFLLIWTSLLLCVGLFSAVNLVPQLLGLEILLAEPIAATTFLLFYLALAVAIARYRLFDLGGWAVNMGLSAIVLLVILALDFAVVQIAGGGWTISLAVVIAAILWLPLRELLLRRVERRRDKRDILLLRGASEVAFAANAEQRPALWAQLLDRQFSPLTVEPTTAATVMIHDDGRSLAIPSPFGGAGLTLRYAGQGTRLFNSSDRSVADALLALVEEMIGAREAYDRGVRAERQRIARDLHDDVGARLMTTLHRNDLETVHNGVREAMADMRLIIDGMSDQSRRLDGLMADLRHETMNRLELAHLHASWPITSLFDDERPVASLPARVLVSVARELVSNVIRHAGASMVSIHTDLSDDRLMLVVHDNGRGFDADDDVRMGNGLRNVRKRLDELGGAMRVVSGSAGTDIEVVLPLPSREQGMPDPAMNG